MVSFSVAGMRPKLAPELLPLPRRGSADAQAKLSTEEGKSDLVPTVLTAAAREVWVKNEFLAGGADG